LRTLRINSPPEIADENPYLENGQKTPLFILVMNGPSLPFSRLEISTNKSVSSKYLAINCRDWNELR